MLLRRLRLSLLVLGRRLRRQLRRYARPRRFCPDDLRQDVGLPPLPPRHDWWRDGGL